MASWISDPKVFIARPVDCAAFAFHTTVEGTEVLNVHTTGGLAV